MTQLILNHESYLSCDLFTNMVLKILFKSLLFNLNLQFQCTDGVILFIFIEDTYLHIIYCQMSLLIAGTFRQRLCNERIRLLHYDTLLLTCEEILLPLVC